MHQIIKAIIIYVIMCVYFGVLLYKRVGSYLFDEPSSMILFYSLVSLKIQLGIWQCGEQML